MEACRGKGEVRTEAMATSTVVEQYNVLPTIHELQTMRPSADQSPARLQSKVITSDNIPTYPHLVHATSTRVVKGEDVMYIYPLPEKLSGMMYMICDGHCGVDAANFVAAWFSKVLFPKLPTKLPNFGSPDELQSFAEHLRKALCDTFVKIDNDWTKLGQHAGTTVTVVLVTGWLTSVANVGDSCAVLDTGACVLELTKPHRLQTNMDEQQRLRATGAHIAPLGFHLQGPAKPQEIGVGPLRLWPGGLCVSRSVGDLDSGAEVSPVPHIRQVILPDVGARLIIASDGLWDCVTYGKSAKHVRCKPTNLAASSLLSLAARDRRIHDDTSIIVVDALPNTSSSFPTLALAASSQKAGKKNAGNLFAACFKPNTEDDLHFGSGGNAALRFYADVDCLIAYPTLQNSLFRASVARDGNTADRPPPRDLTLHGATDVKLYKGFQDTSSRPTSIGSFADKDGDGLYNDRTWPQEDKGGLRSYDDLYAEHTSVVEFGSAPVDNRDRLDDERGCKSLNSRK